MLLEIFVAVAIAGIIGLLLSVMSGEEWCLFVSFALWFIGLCGIVVVELSNMDFEEREPCQCEICCEHKNE